jgi:hypothetical protein
MAITNIIVKIIDKFENDRSMIEEYTAVSAPKLIYKGADDKYQPIMASEFTFNLMVNDKTDGKFFHLYTGNEKRYLVTVEDQDDNLLFEGYLLPDFYSEPYDNGVIFVDLTATDGIGLLKGYYLENQYYKQETSVIKLIAECLKFTRLDKNIVFAPAIESAATDYRWDEIAVNGATYLEGEIEYVFMVGEKMPKRKNVYEILNLLLESLACTLYAQGDTWFIEGINRKHLKTQTVFNYTFEGVYDGVSTVYKNVIDITFFKTPVINIISPWKRVDVEWDCDEDGDLIPSWAIKENSIDGITSFVNRDVFTFWKSNGLLSLNVFSDQLKYSMQYFGTGTVTPGAFPFAIISGNQSPRNLQVAAMYSTGTVVNQAQNPASLDADFIDIKNKKYLKISDAYIDRKIAIEYKLAAKARLIDNDPDDVAYEDVLEKDLANSFKNDFLIGNDILISSKISDSNELCKKPFAKKNNQNVNYPDDLQYLDYFDWTPAYVLAELKLENLDFFVNGFFNTKLYAPLSPDYTSPWYYDYVVQSLSVKISELKTWTHSLERAIDFTTTKDVSIFHGDSIADLTEKQFRFRRFVGAPEEITGEINIISSYIDGSAFVTTWNFIISYEQAQLIIDNPSEFYWNFSLPTGPKTMDQIYGSSGTYGVLWGVYNVSGIWCIALIVTLGNPYFTSISAFSDAYVDVATSEIVYGMLPEDNEWRESWKRYGQTENIRYGVAVGKIYHDVQPEALVQIEGTASQIILPRDIGQFLWRDLKNFIPTRLEINFSEGRTSLLLQEDLHEIVTDYVD